MNQESTSSPLGTLLLTFLAGAAAGDVKRGMNDAANDVKRGMAEAAKDLRG